MKSIWFLLYNVVVIPLLYIALPFASLFHRKIKDGLAGRKETIQAIHDFNQQRMNDHKVIQFNCASLGEYEQIKPILAYLSQKNDRLKKVVCFFSPSGFENMGENPNVDLKIYLPVDFLPRIRKFLNALRPDVVVISKHDIWPNFIWSLDRYHIPVMLINGTMPSDSIMTKPILRSFYKSIYPCFDLIAPASEADRKGFRKVTSKQVNMHILGDTRFDQVLIRSEESKNKDILPGDFFKHKLTVIAGSIWQSDEEHLFPALKHLLLQLDHLFLILVPHEPSPAHVEQILSYFVKEGFSGIRFSDDRLREQLPTNRIVVVDRIGILANLYTYGDIAYVGGSFGPGVHNVMEPAACRLPVMFGPKIFNSPEALALIRREAGFKVANQDEFVRILQKLCEDPQYRNSAGERAYSLVSENKGATEKVLQHIMNALTDQK